MEEVMVKMLLEVRVPEDFRVVITQVLARYDEEAACATGRIADDILGHGSSQLHHELDDVARGAELTILTGAGDLAEHVLVKIALGVGVFHGHAVDHVHDLGEQRGRGDREARPLHVVRVSRTIAAEGAQEGEHVLADDREHFLGFKMLEVRPAQVVISPAFGIIALRDDTAFHRLLQPHRFVYLQGMEVVQALKK